MQLQYFCGGIMMIGVALMLGIAVIQPPFSHAEFTVALMMIAPIVMAVALGGWMFIMGFEDDDEFIPDKDIPRSEPWREEE